MRFILKCRIPFLNSLVCVFQQAGDFATGEEDAVDASGEARLRIAYREAAIALLECYLPNPHRPFVKVYFLRNTHFLKFSEISIGFAHGERQVINVFYNS